MLLGEPAFWAEISFEGSTRPQSLNDELLLTLARRAGGNLLSLDVSGPECSGIELKHQGRPLLEVMAAEGLTARLRSLSAMGKVKIVDTARAAALLAACPALTSVEIELDGAWPGVAEAMHMLPLAGERSCASFNLTEGPEEQTGFVAFVTAISEALASCAVGRVGFFPLRGPEPDFDPLLDLRALIARSTAPAAAVDQAVARLAAALADPEHGPRAVLGGSHCLGSTPILAHMCRALTARSRLSELQIDESDLRICRGCVHHYCMLMII